MFKQSPPSDRPKKLQKKRQIPGSSLSSAQSSDQSLPNIDQKSPSTAGTPNESAIDERSGDRSEYAAMQGTSSMPLAARNSTGETLRPAASPPHSYHSNTDLSDADLVGDDAPKEQSMQPEKERKRHRWRFSRSQNKLEGASPQMSPAPLGTMAAREQTTSRSTMDSLSGQQPRRSFQEPTPLTPAPTDPAAGQTIFGSPPMQSSNTDPVFSDSERERKAGPMSWIRGKIQDRKDKDAERERRTRTPERNRETRESRQDLQLPTEGMPVRGKSFEQQRTEQRAASGASIGAVAAAQLATGSNTATSPTSSTAVTDASPESGEVVSLPTESTLSAPNGDPPVPSNVGDAKVI